MDSEAEFIRSELPDVKAIVQNECWLEGERRGGPVDSHDPEIQARVADIILAGAGEAIRRKKESCEG
jgi:hypothetical protein